VGRPGGGIEDEGAEEALVAFLARLTEADGPLAADRAITLYLGRFAGDEERRRAALQRLSRLLVEFEDMDGGAPIEKLSRYGPA